MCYKLYETAKLLYQGSLRLWQHVLKKVKRRLCEFNAKHPSIFRMLSAFDQPRTLQAS
jgi:hypothetical protein